MACSHLGGSSPPLRQVFPDLVFEVFEGARASLLFGDEECAAPLALAAPALSAGDTPPSWTKAISVAAASGRTSPDGSATRSPLSTRPMAQMQLLPIRLSPGADLRRALEGLVGRQNTDSFFVVAGIGSLVAATLRYAGEPAGTALAGPLEILSISGSLCSAGAHLHMSVSDADGRVHGGHVCYGNEVGTTAEVLLALLPEGSLTRERDARTGFNELVVRSPE